MIHTDEPGFQGITSDSNMRLGLVLPTRVIRQKLDTLLDGQKVGAVAFQPSFDATRGAGSTVRRMIASLFAELAESDSLLANEIAVRSFEEHLALSVLLGLPHSHSERLLQQQTAAAPANVKRAEEFMRADAREPLTIDVIASAAGCTVRALQLAFHRFRGTTPMADRQGRAAASDYRTPNHLIEAQQAAFRRVNRRPNCPAAINCVFCLADSLSVSLGGSPRRYSLHSDNRYSLHSDKREGQLVQHEKSAASLSAGHSTSITCMCGEKITISLEAILSYKGAACWNCGAQLSVNKDEENRESIEALRGLVTRIDKIKSDVQP